MATLISEIPTNGAHLRRANAQSADVGRIVPVGRQQSQQGQYSNSNNDGCCDTVGSRIMDKVPCACKLHHNLRPNITDLNRGDLFSGVNRCKSD